jgi:hypothetical protein
MAINIFTLVIDCQIEFMNVEKLKAFRAETSPQRLIDCAISLRSEKTRYLLCLYLVGFPSYACMSLLFTATLLRLFRRRPARAFFSWQVDAFSWQKWSFSSKLRITSSIYECFEIPVLFEICVNAGAKPRLTGSVLRIHGSD